MLGVFLARSGVELERGAWVPTLGRAGVTVRCTAGLRLL